MNSNPLYTALKAKGPLAFLRRVRRIYERYGITSAQMDQRLDRFIRILRQYNCGATFPITAITLKRHPALITKHLHQNIEFAVHGYLHIDNAHLGSNILLVHMQKAYDIFVNAGIHPKGFRSPYLIHNGSSHETLKATNFSYVSDQSILWDDVVPDSTNLSMKSNYARALDFYNPWRVSEHPSLPRIDGQLVEIPVSLPDDEILVDRFGGTNNMVKETWLRMLSQSYQRGELFTLQLHPERLDLCVDGLSAVLSTARTLKPNVWCARLDEISGWWRDLAKSTIQVDTISVGVYRCLINCPKDAAILLRSVDLDDPISAWMDDYFTVHGKDLTVRTARKPVIGISPSTPISVANFLHQQGYFIEISPQRHVYSYYIDQENYNPDLEVNILRQIESSACPLVKLGRWPGGARSALAVTGDIDAFSLWDFCLRFFGK